jgi:cytochrome c3-like protein
VSSGWKIALVVLVVVIGAAGGGRVWLNGRIQTTEYCASCHVIAPYYNSWKSAGFLANTHAQAKIVCQDCHTRTVKAAMTELVSNVTHSYEVPLKDHRVRPEDCLRCHGSYEYLGELTKDLKGPDGYSLGRNPHDSHWGRLDCGICHKMHKASVDFCSACHGFPITGPGWVTSPHAPSLWPM